MKIKVCISNYGGTQLEYMYRSIDAFKNYKKYQVDVIVYTTVPLDIPHVLVEKGIGKSLPFSPRKEMAESINDYDIFIYNENDMLITEDNIDAFLEHSKTLNDGEVSGFIRHEYNTRFEKILLDLNPHWGGLIKNKTKTSFEVHNVHQGCWILLKADFIRCISSGGFSFNPHDGPYGMLEQGASDPYTQCGLKKVFPLEYNLCERLLIHHMPNKYIKYPEWIECGITLEDFFKHHI